LKLQLKRVRLEEGGKKENDPGENEGRSRLRSTKAGKREGEEMTREGGKGLSNRLKQLGR